jgi:phosphoribosylformylglycinamidine (FGAM) synthase-like enzyme
MTTLKVTKKILLGMALLLATGALAAEKSQLTIFDPVNVAGTQLRSGDYTLQWQGNGPNVELSILKGKTVMVTTPARLVDKDQAAPAGATTTKLNDDGTRSLSEIRVRGKKYVLEIGNSETAVAGNRTK